MAITFVPVVVALVFDRDKRLLLIRRQNHPFKGLWALPGGRIERGEHINSAAIREIREETGILTKFLKLWGVMSELVIQQGKLSHHHLIHICLLQPVHHATPSLNSEYIRWLAGAPDSHSCRLIPSDGIIVCEAFNCSQGGYYNCTINIDRNDIRIAEFEEVNAVVK